MDRIHVNSYISRSSGSAYSRNPLCEEAWSNRSRYPPRLWLASS
jgi:hypothetical protein